MFVREIPERRGINHINWVDRGSYNEEERKELTEILEEMFGNHY